MKPYFEDQNFILYNGNCIDVMKEIGDELVDLVVTSPPYNVGIEYDSWNDTMSFDDYLSFVREFFNATKSLLRTDSRIAINIPFEVNMTEHGGRVNIVGEYMKIMNDIFTPFGTVRLREPSPHRVKNTAWGSFASPSCPYIYNTEECVLIYHNGDKHKKDRNNKNTKIPSDVFKNLVKGIWDYRPETSGLTKANFSIDIPINAITILTYEGDTVLDPFIGSGTTSLACVETGRKCIGIEISEKYCEITVERYLKHTSSRRLF